MVQIEKPWGYEDIITETEVAIEGQSVPVVLKRVFLDGEEMSSKHRHRETNVLVYVVDGIVEVQLEEDVVQVEAGESYFVEKGTAHQLINLESDVTEALYMLLPFSAEDVGREEDPYGRS